LNKFAQAFLMATALVLLPGSAAFAVDNAAALKALDPDDDGTIDLKEADAGALKVFKEINPDNDGTLDAKELEAARADDALAMGYIHHDWELNRIIQTVHGDHDVFGDGRLTLIPLPGHTLGSIGVHAVLDRSGAFLLASDAAPVEASLRQHYAPSNTVDVDLYLASLDIIGQYEREGAMVLFGHDDAQWQRVRKGRNSYD